MNQPQKKIKPWSISTTIRNPERLKNFLRVLSKMGGKQWNKETQTEFQIRLIQAREYGLHNKQFYNGLDRKDVGLIESEEPISLERARNIFNKKQYKDPSMRGRTSFKPLEKFGFATRFNNTINITSLGRNFLNDRHNFGDLILKSLLKWQLPNPLDKAGFPEKFGYNIKPFITTLHLINEVNALSRENKEKEKGISLWEFQTFVLTLIDYKKIRDTAKEIIDFRTNIRKTSNNKQEQYRTSQVSILRPEFEIKNLTDYADNALRYFRLTKLIHLRGAGRYIDLEPLRITEIKALLNTQTGEAEIFPDDIEYQKNMGNFDLPILPWESIEQIKAIAENIKQAIQGLGGKVETIPNFEAMTPEQQKNHLEELRKKASSLQEEKDKQDMRLPSKIYSIANLLLGLQKKDNKIIINKPILLEHLTTLGFVALNDAMKIQPNYPKGDDNLPLNTAPAGKADIECYYKNFSVICEVTLSNGRAQWVLEGQPVLRHLHEFEMNQKKDTFCIFIAPSIHQDTANTFLFAINKAYENKKRLIAPLTIKQFSGILKFCAQRYEQNNPLKQEHIKQLLTSIANSAENYNSGQDWRESIPAVISNWQRNFKEKNAN